MLLAIEFDNLHQVLRTLYTEMMPLCSDMIGVARALAGLGALFYVSSRVWQSLARAEPIDVYPMLRPFAIGLCILFFPTLVLSTINGVLSPIVKGTEQILNAQTFDMQAYQQQKDQLEKEAMLRDPETAYLVSEEEFDKKLKSLGWSPSDLATISGMYVERGMYDMKKSIKQAFLALLELCFQSASLIIDTIRTFFLIVLSILGPIAFAISVVYTIFMLIGIVGFFTIPTVSNWIIQAGGMGNYNRNVNQSAQKAGNVAAATAGSIAGNITGRLTK